MASSNRPAGSSTTLLDDVDRAYSRFRPDSELSRLNAMAGKPMAVSPLFGLAIEAGLRAGRLSDGLVDPTVGRAMRAIGYDRDFGRALTSPDPLVLRLEPIPGWQAVHYDRVAPRRLARPGRGARPRLDRQGARCRPLRGGRPRRDGPWRRPREPRWRHRDRRRRPGRRLARPRRRRELDADRCRRRSDRDPRWGARDVGHDRRRWTRGGVTLHHLIDPRTGLPAEGPWRTASVVAASCVDANIAATAAIVRGRSAVPWLDGLGLAARLVAVAGQVVRLGGWPEPIDRRAWEATDRAASPASSPAPATA